MAVSGTYNFYLDIDEVIQEAMEMIVGEDTLGHEPASARRSKRVSIRRPMPPEGVAKIGAEGLVSPTVFRKTARSPSGDRAALSNCGAITAQLRWSACPALIPPSRGSTRCSNTWSPTQDRTTVPTARSPSGNFRSGRPSSVNRVSVALSKRLGSTASGSSRA